MHEPLFRQAAVDALSRSHLGVPSIGIPRQVIATALVWFAGVLILVVFVGQSNYARTVTVVGTLDESQTREVIAKQLGDLVEVNVQEGDPIQAGQILGRLVKQQHDPDVQRLLSLQSTRMERLQADQKLAVDSYRNQRRQLKNQLSATLKQMRIAVRELRLQQDKTDSLANQLIRSRTLRDQGYLSHQHWLQLSSQVVSERQQLRRQQRQLAILRQQYHTGNDSLAELANSHMSRRSQLAQRLVEMEQNLLDQRRQREQVLYAPVSGKVTRIHESPGATLTPGSPIIHVSTGDNVRAATLMLPPLAAAHLSQGQQLSVEIEAYPADQYGYLAAEVLQISDHTITVPGGNRVYVARIAIDAGAPASSAGRLYLPGMTIKSSVTLGHRMLITWLIAPLRRILDAA